MLQDSGEVATIYGGILGFYSVSYIRFVSTSGMNMLSPNRE